MELAELRLAPRADKVDLDAHAVEHESSATLVPWLRRTDAELTRGPQLGGRLSRDRSAIDMGAWQGRARPGVRARLQERAVTNLGLVALGRVEQIRDLLGCGSNLDIEAALAVDGHHDTLRMNAG